MSLSSHTLLLNLDTNRLKSKYAHQISADQNFEKNCWNVYECEILERALQFAGPNERKSVSEKSATSLTDRRRLDSPLVSKALNNFDPPFFKVCREITRARIHDYRKIPPAEGLCLPISSVSTAGCALTKKRKTEREREREKREEKKRRKIHIHPVIVRLVESCCSATM